MKPNRNSNACGNRTEMSSPPEAPTKYNWPIDNFSKLDQSKDGPGYITNANHDFVLNVHPKLRLYDHPQPKYQTMLVLSMNQCNVDKLSVQCNVHYQLAILGANGEKHFTRDLKAQFVKDKINFDAQYSLSWDYLTNPANRLLVDGKLKIYCELYVLDPESSSTQTNKFPTQISQDYGTLLESGKLSDVTLVVGKKDFKAHKLVLVTRSPVFCAMFEHCDTKEAMENRVEISDISIDVFEKLLRFIYTENADSLDQYATELLQAADKYQLDSLKSTCEQYLGTSLTPESFSSIVALADMYSAKHLEKQCIDYLIEHVKEVIKTEGWTKLIKTRSDLGCRLLQCVITKGED